MANDATVSILEPASPTSLMDVTTLNNPQGTAVKSERICIRDNGTFSLVAAVANGVLTGTENGLVVRIAGQASAPLNTYPVSSTTRQLGIIYGSANVSLQQQVGGSQELLVQLSTSGTVYDGRLIRALTSTSDIITAYDQVYDGAAYLSRRAPSTFKTASATASGATAVWTPTAGKKFRLMKYLIEITGDVAQTTSGDLDISVQDVSNTIFTHSVYIPSSAGSTFAHVVTGLDLGDRGYLSNAANNVMNIYLSATLNSGKVRINAMGTEE